MRTLFLNDDTMNSAPCVATIGFFDGVHRGHRFLIGSVMEEARQTGMESMAITFDRHPRLVLDTCYKPKMLNTPYERNKHLEATGVDICAVVPFTVETAALSAYDFMKKIMRDRLNVRTLITGYDNRFGHNRSEGFEDYVRYGAELGISVRRAKAFTLDGINISSSVVRALLDDGEVAMAALCLGYHYRLAGRVVGGMRQGRRMGFPTANIDISGSGKMVPARGVYAVRVRVEGTGGVSGGMMNICMRPTFDGDNVSLEVNIFDFSGDIYGKKIEVEFIKRIRSEHKFASAEKLRSQLAADSDEARKILATDIKQDF